MMSGMPAQKGVVALLRLDGLGRPIEEGALKLVVSVRDKN